MSGGRRVLQAVLCALDSSITFGHLSFDPAIGSFEAVAKPDGRFPAEAIDDQGVIAVAPVYAFWSISVIGALESNAGNLFHKINQAVDAHEFTGSEIDWLVDFAIHNRLRALYAVVDIHEAACLLPVSPDVDFVNAGPLGLNHLATDRGWSLFAPACPTAMRSVDIVITGHAAG